MVGSGVAFATSFPPSEVAGNTGFAMFCESDPGCVAASWAIANEVDNASNTVKIKANFVIENRSCEYI